MIDRDEQSSLLHQRGVDLLTAGDLRAAIAALEEVATNAFVRAATARIAPSVREPQ